MFQSVFSQGMSPIDDMATDNMNSHCLVIAIDADKQKDMTNIAMHSAIQVWYRTANAFNCSYQNV